MCVDCGARCCKYYALEIDEADCPEEYEKIRWYLAHENTWVFIDSDKWYLLVNNKCRFLGRDSMCTIYDRRPSVCRDHDRTDCERDDSPFYDVLFKGMKEFEAYLEDIGERYW